MQEVIVRCSWFAAQGFPAAQAITGEDPRVLQVVDLDAVSVAGQAITVPFNQGFKPIRKLLLTIGARLEHVHALEIDMRAERYRATVTLLLPPDFPLKQVTILKVGSMEWASDEPGPRQYIPTGRPRGRPRKVPVDNPS